MLTAADALARLKAGNERFLSSPEPHGDASLNHDPDGTIKFITDEINAAVGGETDEERACVLNVRHGVARIEESLRVHVEEMQVVGALYHIGGGHVDWL